MTCTKIKRIRDPIHGLIAFDLGDDTDRIAWDLLNAPEFQRLRRIRQLGFVDFIFPGATHSRFLHSIGVFHTARRLLGIFQRQLGANYDEARGRCAALAALLHDVGHGPFSHSFEAVEAHCGREINHEEWTAEIIRGDTELHRILEGAEKGLAEDVAALIALKGERDLYAGIVSGEFDADRLDYLRRDHYMTGSGTGGIDFEWLLDCLCIESPSCGDRPGSSRLYLEHKGLSAAEEFLLARSNLARQVYLHRASRGVELMLAALLKRMVELIQAGDGAKIDLPENFLLVRYFLDEPVLSHYLALDDDMVRVATWMMANSVDPALRRLAAGIKDRRFYKCIDCNATGLTPAAVRSAADTLGFTGEGDLLEDVLVYDPYELGDSGQHILVERHPGGELVNITELSPVVKAMETIRGHCFYVPDDDARTRLLEASWKNAT